MAQAAAHDFESDAGARIERMSRAWGSLLLGSHDPAAAAVLRSELRSLRGLSSGRSHADVSLLCDRVDELTEIAHRRNYDVPEELFLTVSMAIELLAVLLGDLGGDADIAGFLVELDAVLRDARLLPDPLEPSVPSGAPHRTPAPPVTSKRPTTEAPDRLSRATRVRLARVATAVYLEAVRASGPSALRLRESWGSLKGELVELGQVSLRAHLVPLLQAVELREDARLKNVCVVSEFEDAPVSLELAQALAQATLRVIDHAVSDGIEAPAERAHRGKPSKAVVRVEGRIAGGRVVVRVEDDGAGVDVAAGTRAAGLAGAVDLSAVREAFAREEGSVRLDGVVGRGTIVTLSIPAVRTMNVRTFRSPSSNVLLAVDAAWSAEGARAGAASRLDLVGALGLRSGVVAATCRIVVFGRGKQSFEVQVRAAPTLNVATRLFPPDPESAAEVVLVGDTEAVLLRPDLLARVASQSTIPPPILASETSAISVKGHLMDNQPTLRPRAGED